MWFALFYLGYINVIKNLLHFSWCENTPVISQTVKQGPLERASGNGVWRCEWQIEAGNLLMCSTSGRARASIQKAERTRRKQSLKIHTLLSALGVRKWTAFGSAWTLGKWKSLASSSSIFLFSPSSPLLTPVSLQLKLIIKIRANDFPLLCPELLTYKIN